MVELIITLIITIPIAIIWVRGIDNFEKYKRENPDFDPNQGWLDWDKKQENEKTNFKLKFFYS